MTMTKYIPTWERKYDRWETEPDSTLDFLDEEISEEEMEDLKNKKCEFEGCKSQPFFDIEGGKGRFCSKHKNDNMIDVKNKRCIEITIYKMRNTGILEYVLCGCLVIFFKRS